MKFLNCAISAAALDSWKYDIVAVIKTTQISTIPRYRLDLSLLSA